MDLLPYPCRHCARRLSTPQGRASHEAACQGRAESRPAPTPEETPTEDEAMDQATLDRIQTLENEVKAMKEGLAAFRAAQEAIPRHPPSFCLDKSCGGCRVAMRRVVRLAQDGLLKDLDEAAAGAGLEQAAEALGDAYAAWKRRKGKRPDDALIEVTP